MPEEKKPHQWEYATSDVSSPMRETLLDRMGAAGWELVAVVALPSHCHYIFKRPLP